MLKNQKWINYAEDFHIEYLQALDEGKDVKEYEELCDAVTRISISKEANLIAEEVAKILNNAPVTANYQYCEPSDLLEIKQSRPKKKHRSINKVNRENLFDKISGAWAGRIAGCLLGMPVEGYKRERLQHLLEATSNNPMSRYIMKKEFSENLIETLNIDPNNRWADNIGSSSPTDDDTDYTVMSLRILESYGRDFSPDNVMEAWLSYLPIISCCTAERVAYKNAAQGILPPVTAVYNNPFREWIGAQIRIDFYGYINPGEPEKAAEMAWRDASISHIKNGIYGAMFIAAMIACAFIHNDIKDIIETALQEIPEKCRLREKVIDVLGWYKDGMSDQEVIDQIHSMYDEYNGHHWCHAISNTVVVVAALLYGKGDFTKSICLAVQAAFDTDCNGATVGSIIGAMLGMSNIPAYWYETYNLAMRSNVLGYSHITVDELANKTLKYIE